MVLDYVSFHFDLYFPCNQNKPCCFMHWKDFGFCESENRHCLLPGQSVILQCGAMLTIVLCEHIVMHCSVYSMKLSHIPQKINYCYLCLGKGVSNFSHLNSLNKQTKKASLKPCKGTLFLKGCTCQLALWHSIAPL